MPGRSDDAHRRSWCIVPRRKEAHIGDPRANLILGALPDDELEQLLAVMHREPLVPYETLSEQDEPTQNMYFPIAGAVSLMTVMQDGSTMEPGIIGTEGMLGFPFGLGDDVSRWRSVVQLPGEALVLSRARVRTIMRETEHLTPLLTHYAGLLVALVAQSAACSQFHPTRQRCARWLLLMHDRAAADAFPLTHDHLAAMLGVHRPAATIAVGELRDEGLVATQRGSVEIIDREGLERVVCECYERIQIKYDETVEVDAGDSGHEYQPSEDQPG